MNKIKYFAPKTEALVLKPEGVVCESGGINSMVLLEGIDGDKDYE